MHCNLLCIKVYINWMYINKKIYCVLSCWTQILSVTMNWRQQKCFYTTFDTITPWFKIKLSHLGQYISEWPNTLFSSLLLPPHHHPYISDEHINCSFTFMPWTKPFPKQTKEVSSHFHNNLFFLFLFIPHHISLLTRWMFLLLISISDYINGKDFRIKKIRISAWCALDSH